DWHPGDATLVETMPLHGIRAEITCAAVMLQVPCIVAGAIHTGHALHNGMREQGIYEPVWRSQRQAPHDVTRRATDDDVVNQRRGGSRILLKKLRDDTGHVGGSI